MCSEFIYIWNIIAMSIVYVVALKNMNAENDHDESKVKGIFIDKKDAEGYLNMLLFFNEDKEYTHPFMFEKPSTERVVDI